MIVLTFDPYVIEVAAVTHTHTHTHTQPHTQPHTQVGSYRMLWNGN